MTGRSSKRLRGEAVDKLSMFDDPEAAARRLRQAVQPDVAAHADASLGPNPALNPGRHSRAVRFQEPSAQPSSSEAMQIEVEADGQSLDHGHVTHMDLEDSTPHTGLTHPGTAPDSTASGLRLTLSASTTAPRPSDSAAQASLPPATSHAQDSASQDPQLRPQRLGTQPQPAGSSNNAAGPAVHAEGEPMLSAPSTAGRAVASSQDSLRLAAEQARAIATAPAVATLAAAAHTADVAARQADSDAAPIDVARSEAAVHLGAHSTATTEAANHSLTSLDPGMMAGVASMTGDKQVQQGVGYSPASGAQQSVQEQPQEGDPRQEEVWRDGSSTVLASTTRPNVPDSRRSGVVPAKCAPALHKGVSGSNADLVSSLSS